MPSEDSNPGLRLLRDPLTWIACLVWAAAQSPSIVPFLSEQATIRWSDLFSDLPSLLLVFAATILATQRTRLRRTRIFWILVRTSVLAWLSVRFLYVIVPFEIWGLGMDLAADTFHLGGYLLLAIALEFFWLPSDEMAEPGTVTDATPARERALLLTLAFALLAVLAITPVVVSPDVFGAWVTSLFLYAVMDTWLMARAMRRRSQILETRWRSAFGWFALSAALWMAGDVIEGLMYLEVVPWFDSGTPLDILWALPSLTFFFFVRIATPPSPDAGLIDGIEGATHPDDPV